MKYVIERASFGILNNSQPCEGAELGTWYPKRGAGIERWTIEIGTLDDLMSFIEKHGSVIVYESDFLDTGLPLIKIYDSYIE